MDGPLVVGIIGSVIVAAALLLTWRLITPRRYKLGNVGFDGRQPELERLVIDQGRLAMLGFVGAAVQLVSIVWSAAR